MVVQIETSQLLQHLSVRLLTLTQATFLPGRMTHVKVENEEEEEIPVLRRISCGSVWYKFDWVYEGAHEFVEGVKAEYLAINEKVFFVKFIFFGI